MKLNYRACCLLSMIGMLIVGLTVSGTAVTLLFLQNDLESLVPFRPATPTRVVVRWDPAMATATAVAQAVEETLTAWRATPTPAPAIPTSFVADGIIRSAKSQGDPNAPINLVVFGDFQ